MKIPMTVPVTIKFHGQSCVVCDRSYIMSFYLPKAFQSSAPEPNNPAVYGEKRYEMVAYVRFVLMSTGDMTRLRGIDSKLNSLCLLFAFS